MKKEDLIRIFGTENPSVEQYRDWVLENDPFTFQSWKPSLNFQEKSVLSDPELVEAPEFNNLFGSVSIEKNEWDSYPEKWLIIEGASLIISCVKKAEKENFSNENLLLCLHELENLQKDCINKSSNYCVYYMVNVRQTLEKYGIFVSEAIDNLKKKVWEKKMKYSRSCPNSRLKGET